MCSGLTNDLASLNARFVTSCVTAAVAKKILMYNLFLILWRY